MTGQWDTDAPSVAALGAEGRKRPVQREWRAQEVDWAFLMKALPHGALAYGIDQAGKRSHAANRRRLDRGCKPGVGDTYLLWNSVTLWLERKSGSAVSDAQKLFRDQVRANGGHWALVKSTEDVEAACLAAGIPLRATLGGIRERIAAQNERLPAKKRTAGGARKPKAAPAALKVAARWRKAGLF